MRILYQLLALICLTVFSLLPIAGCSAKETGLLVSTQGDLPKPGRIVVRSGLAWMNEDSLLFQKVFALIQKQLEEHHNSIIKVPASELAPKPATTLPKGAEALIQPQATPLSEAGTTAATAQMKAEQLAREGQLPKLRLKSYTIPSKDSDLSASVRSVTPPDPAMALFALSQEKGLPVLYNALRIPARIPAETMRHDPFVADYALIVTFAHMQPMGGNSVIVKGTGSSSAPGLIGGVSVLGKSSPISSGASTRPADPYFSQDGYQRGYSGSSLDADHTLRDYDYYQRDYTLKKSDPAYATPPGDRGGGATPFFSGSPALPSLSKSHVSRVAQELLHLEWYDLAPVRNGKPPQKLWEVFVQKVADDKGLEAALPDMIEAAFSQNSSQDD